jgi:hypothetical protein
MEKPLSDPGIRIDVPPHEARDLGKAPAGPVCEGDKALRKEGGVSLNAKKSPCPKYPMRMLCSLNIGINGSRSTLCGEVLAPAFQHAPERRQ